MGKGFKYIILFLILLGTRGAFATSPGDTVEISLANPKIVGDYFTCDVRLRRVDAWTYDPATSWDYGTKLQSVDAMIKFNPDVFENGELEFAWDSTGYIYAQVGAGYRAYWAALHWTHDPFNPAYYLLLADPRAGFELEFLNTTDYIKIGYVRGKIIAGSSGSTQVEWDKNAGIGMGESTEPDIAGIIGVMFAGSGDIPVGGDTKPDPPLLAAMDTVFCGPQEIDYTLATAPNSPNGADTCIWYITDVTGGAIASSDAAITTVQDSGVYVTIDWKKPGVYLIHAFSQAGSAVSDTVSQKIEIKQLPTANLENAFYACMGDAADLTYSDLQPAGASALWLGPGKSFIAGGGNNPLPVSVAGDYWLALDYDGCKDTLQTLVELDVEPFVDIISPLTSCDTAIQLKVADSDGAVKWLANDKTTPIDSAFKRNGNTQRVWVYAVAGRCETDTMPVDIQFGVNPSVVVVNPQTSCGLSFHLTAYATGGSLTWTDETGTPVSTAQTVAANGDYKYKVYAQDGTCRSADTTIVVKVGAIPQVDVAGIQTSCDPNFGNLTYTNLSGGKAEWWNASFQKVSAVTPYKTASSGRYYLYLEDGGCKDTIPVDLQLNTKPRVDLLPEYSSCTNTIDLTYSGLTEAGATVTWLKPDYTVLGNGNPYSFTATASDTYHVGIVGNGCGDTLDVQVKINTLPSARLKREYTSCNTEVILSYTDLTGAKKTPIWLDQDKQTLLGSTNPLTVSNASTGSYYLVLEGDGCSDTLTAIIRTNTPPTVDLQPEFTHCTNNVVVSYDDLSDATATAAWLKPDKSFLANGDTPYTILNAQNATYYLALTGTGCTDTLPFEVKPMTPPHADLLSQYTSCTNEVVLSYTGLTDPGATSVWLDQDRTTVLGTGPSITVTGATTGTYYLALAEAACEDTLDVIVQTNTPPTATLEREYSSCSNNVIVSYKNLSDATATVTWLKPDKSFLANGNTPYTILNAQKATYYLALTGNGCSDTLSFEVKPMTPPHADLLPQYTSCTSDVVLSYSGLTNPLATTTWLAPDKTTALGSNTPLTVTGASTGTYYLALADGSCTDTLDVIVQTNTPPTATLEREYSSCSNNVIVSYKDLSDATATAMWLNPDKSFLANGNTPYTILNAQKATYYLALTGNGCSDTLSFEVKPMTPPHADLLPQYTSCTSDVVLSYSGLTNPLATTTWLAPDKTTALGSNTPLTVTGASTGTYYLALTDGSCTDTLDVIVQTNTPPTATLEREYSSCSNNVIVSYKDLSDATATVAWLKPDKSFLANGNTPYTILNAQKATYYLALTGNGCSDTLSFEVKPMTPPHADLLPQYTSCTSDVVLSYSGLTNPLATTTWLASDKTTALGSNSPLTVTGASTGTYYLALTDGSCTDTLDVIVQTNTPPTATLEREYSSCSNNVIVSYKDLSDATATAMWLNPDKSFLANGNTPYTILNAQKATYYLALTGNGCSDTLSFEVKPMTPPHADLLPQYTSCTSDVVLSYSGLTNPLATTTWLAPDKTTALGSNTPLTVTGASTGTYYLALADGSCTDTLDVIVQTNTPPTATLEREYSSCSNNVIVSYKDLSDATATVAWLNPDKSFLANGNTPYTILNVSDTIYYLALAGNGCSDTLAVKVKAGTKPKVDILNEYTSCNDTVTLTYSGLTDALAQVTWLALDYSVLSKNNPYTFKAGAAGTYHIGIVANGCGDTLDFDVKPNTSPDVVGLPDLMISCGDTLLSFTALTDSRATFEWLDGDKNPIGNTNPLAIHSPGKYYLEITGSTGCTDKVLDSVEVRPAVVLDWLPGKAVPATASIGSNITVEAAATGGTPGYTYHWVRPDGNSSDSTYTLSSLTAGTHYFELYAEDAQHCRSNTLLDSVKVVAGSDLKVYASSVYGDVVCGNGAAVLQLDSVVGAAAGNLTIEWMLAGSTTATGTDSTYFTPVLSANTDYVVKVTDANLNVGYDTVKLQVNGANTSLVVFAGPDMTVPQSNTTTVLLGTVAGSAPDTVWHWVPAAKLDNAGIQYPTTPSDLPGNQTYYLYVTSGNCVSNIDTVEVKVESGNDAFSIVATAAPASMCLNNTSLLRAKVAAGTATPLVWQWSPSTHLNTATGDSVIFTATAPGTYEYIVRAVAAGKAAAAKVQVTVNPDPAPEIALRVNTVCIGDTLRVYETNNMAGVNYRWLVNGVAQSGDYYVLTAADDYEIRVVGETPAGCISDTFYTNAYVRPRPDLDWKLAPPLSVRAGGSASGSVEVVSGGLPGFSYNWLSHSGAVVSDSNFSITAATGISYNLAVYATDANGCVSDTLNHTIAVLAAGQLYVDLTSRHGTQVCQDGVAILDATVSGGTLPYTYEWYKKDQPATILRRTVTNSTTDVMWVNASDADEYVVRVYDAAVTVYVGADTVGLTLKPGVTAPAIDAGPDMTVLTGGKTVLTPTVTGGNAPYAWNWTPANQLNGTDEYTKQYPQTVSLNAEQEYKAYVVDQNSCVSPYDSVKVTVDPNGFNVTVDPVAAELCMGNTLFIESSITPATVNGLTYSWTPVDGLSATDKDTVTFTPAAAGNRTLLLTVTDGTRIATAKTEVKVKADVAPKFTLTASGDCQHTDTIRVVYAAGDGNKATSYEWKVDNIAVAGNNGWLALNTTGNHLVEVVGKNSACASEKDTLRVDVKASPVITRLAMVDSCGQVVLKVEATGAKANDGYSWTSVPAGRQNASDPTLYTIDGIAGSYLPYTATVSVSNEHCTVTQDISGQVYDKPVGIMWSTRPQDVNVGDAIPAKVKVFNGTSPYVFHWTSPAEAMPVGGATDTTRIDPAVYAEYRYEVYATDQYGCISDTLRDTVTVNGGKVEVIINSQYGDVVCQDGGAMLVATVKGSTASHIFEWYDKANVGNILRRMVNGEQDTFWVAPATATDYVVEVKGMNGTVLAKDTISLTIDPSLRAPVVDAGPDMSVQPGGKTALLGSVTPAAAAVKWHWMPVEKLESAADTGYQYPQTARLLAEQKYYVHVTEGICVSKPDRVKVDIDATNALCLEVQPQDAQICRNNSVRMVSDLTCGTLTPSATYSWLPVTDIDRADTTQALFTAPTDGTYTYVVMVEDGGKRVAARTTIRVKAFDAPLLTLTGKSDCMNDTLAVRNSGEPQSAYNWYMDGLLTGVNDSLFVLAQTGSHTIQVVAQAANGCSSDTVGLDMKIGEVPDALILENSMAVYKDSVFDLHAQTLAAADYLFEWRPGTKIDGDSLNLQITVEPVTEDVSYTFTAASRLNEACKATDTVNIYLIPDSIGIDIDRGPGNTDVVLKWDHTQPQLRDADSVRIMAIKWDGYAVADSYKPRAMSLVEADSFLVDIANDTLEFFYINASRYIEELDRSYYSHSSDTVGYFRQWIYPVSGLATNENYISYPFDMTSKGLVTSQDLGRYLGSFKSGTNAGKLVINSISVYTSRGQNWNSYADLYSLSQGSWVNLTPAFNLQQGDVYRIILASKASNVELLLYGKLPSKYSYSLLTFNSTDDRVKGDNYVLYPLSLAVYRELQEVGNSISSINSVARYDFAGQNWNTYFVQKLFGVWTGQVPGYGWAPLRVIVNSDSIWKK